MLRAFSVTTKPFRWAPIRFDRINRSGCPVVRLFLLTVCCFIAAEQIASAELIYSKSRRFRIPFQFDQSELKRIGAKEVRLFVSQDNRQWHAVETAALNESRFTFEAPADGVYWFSVKSIAANGAEFPPGPHQASLNVQVDTVAPQLELTLEEVESGRVRLTWLASDEFIDPNSLQLESMEPGANVWHPVAIRGQERGQTSWETEQPGPLQVRGRIADVAGNIGTAAAETTVNGRSSRSMDRLEFGKPVATRMEPLINSEPELATSPALSPSLPTEPTTPLPKLISMRGAPAPINSASSSTGSFGQESLPVLNTISDPIPKSNETKSSSNASLRYLNSLLFRMGYNLQEVGPSGVSQVDLYITEDGGKQWFHYGVDPDRVSPMEISVPKDGEYGFAFRVTNGQGLVPVPPQPGEAPETTVVVDRVAPTATIHPVRYADRKDLNQVLISWTTRETDLAERSVALSYSTTGTGPWIPIQNWQPNAGQLVWTVPSTLNQSFYVRLELRDRAGNVSSAQTDSPFLIDRSQPRARVTEIESLEAAR
ncbi:MAG TPA: hypothetical protein VNQ76_13190 [Planctomicrobium sp.]|nr:hypothetical protein [Planctomicrobium sp.]